MRQKAKPAKPTKPVDRKRTPAAVPSANASIKAVLSEIALTKERLKALERQLVAMRRAAAAKTAASAKVVALKSAAKAKATAVDLDPLSPEGLAAQRKRLDLTVDACAALLGVSWATVHNWEKGATPRPRHHRSILSLRRLSPQDAEALLEMNNPEAAKRLRRTRRMLDRFDLGT